MIIITMPISFTTAGMQSLLSDIDPNKAQGHEITPFILKNCAFEIAPILQVIFEPSLNSGILPSDWLTASICSRREIIVIHLTIDLYL